MNAQATLPAAEIDGDDRLNARRLAAARVLCGLVEAMKRQLGDNAPAYYESHLALGLGKALLELSEGALIPQLRERLDAALPGIVEDFFQRAEAVMETPATGTPPHADEPTSLPESIQ